MKHIIILGDGMADEPIASLGNLTPLQAAYKPAIDYVARQGRCGTLTTVPKGFTPNSEIANLGILGYDVVEVYEGRGPLEAASIGVDMADDEIALRCNIVCVENGILKNHSAGHITTAEASQLIDALNAGLSTDDISFHCGVSYRNLLKIRHGDKRVDCTPPHDVPGATVADILPKALTPEAEPTAALLRDLMARSVAILENHPVNVSRRERGLDPANMIWPWSAGYRPSMKTISEVYGIGRGAVISAVDLIKGMGRYAGLDVINVEGVTGLYNTNYEGKAKAAIDALNNGYDFVFLHIEASDEAGHEGDVDLKIRTIENLDSRIVRPVLEATAEMCEPVTIAVLPDHPTPCVVRTHTSNPVPFAIYNPLVKPDAVDCFDEFTVAGGAFGHLTIKQFMPAFLTYGS